MEKITLKPVAKELLHRSAEDGIYLDVLLYEGAGNQEKSLGSLFIIGQIKYSGEDLSYMISLASSLAKREYYSEESVQGQNAKKAFERTLGKLNEVLDDFFQNKNLKLNIGLAAIAGNDIYISRLGKLKVALARNDKYIDILNNIELFNKDAEDAKQFSNIISGKLYPQDKIFAYFPTRSVTAREKQLNDLFIKESQEIFAQKIAHLAASVNNFSCCGVHVAMREIKEIPVETRPNYTRPIPSSTPRVAEIQKKEGISNPTVLTSANDTDKKEEAADAVNQPDIIPQERPRIIPAEFNITKRANLLTPMLKQFSRFKNFGQLGFRARSRGFLLIAAIVIIPLIAVIAFRSIGPSGETKSAVTKAKENIKLAQSRISQSDTKEARSLLQAALLNVTGIAGKKTEGVRAEITQILGGVNRVSDKQPQLYFPAVSSSNPDPASNNSNFKANLIAAYSDLVAVANEGGSIFSITQDGASELAQLKIAPRFLFDSKSAVSVFNGSDGFGVYNLETKKAALYALKNPTLAIDALVYENNLYLLANNSIYKYADAVTGSTKRTVWGSDNASGTLVAIAADGNIYALNSDGKLIKYFKGAKAGEIDLQLVPAASSRIVTFKDSAFLYLADKANALVYVFDKATGELKTTYNLSAAGAISDISISPDGSVWIFSTDNKVWRISN